MQQITKRLRRIELLIRNPACEAVLWSLRPSNKNLRRAFPIEPPGPVCRAPIEELVHVAGADLNGCAEHLPIGKVRGSPNSISGVRCPDKTQVESGSIEPTRCI